MSRADEIAQGLRHEDGSLTFSLVAEEYSQGHADFDAGTPAPRLTTPSYDLGRARAARLADEAASVLASINADRARCNARLREMLADNPAALAEFEAAMAAISAPQEVKT